MLESIVAAVVRGAYNEATTMPLSDEMEDSSILMDDDAPTGMTVGNDQVNTNVLRNGVQLHQPASIVFEQTLCSKWRPPSTTIVS
jgi:hypothetical protein